MASHFFPALTTTGFSRAGLFSGLLSRKITGPWVDLDLTTHNLVVVYDFSSDGQLSERTVVAPIKSTDPSIVLSNLPDQGNFCRIYIAAVPQHFSKNELDNHLGSVTPLCEQPKIKGFGSLAAQWSEKRCESRHALQIIAAGPKGFHYSEWLNSSQILIGNVMRVTPSIRRHQTQSGGLGFVILLDGSTSESAREKSDWMETAWKRYIQVFVEEGERLRSCLRNGHSEELRVQLHLLQFYRTALRLQGDFSTLVEMYDQLRSHRGGPQHSTLQPSVLADVVGDAYNYNIFLDTASATATMTKSLVGAIRATSLDQEKAQAIQCLLAETEGLSDGLTVPFAQLANRLEHYIALSSMSRNIEDTVNNRILSLLACIFLPLSLATSLLSMSTRFTSLGPLLYDFCGVVVLFASLVAVVFLLLKVYQTLRGMVDRMKPNWSLPSRLFTSALVKWVQWIGIFVAWALVLSSFIVGMVVDISLGFRILGYGIAGLVGATGVGLLALLTIWRCFFCCM